MPPKPETDEVYLAKRALYDALPPHRGLPLPPSTPAQLDKGRYDYPVTDGTTQPKEKWMVEALAVGPEDNDWRACKLMFMVDHKPNGDDDASLRARVSGQFRVTYGEWAAKLSVTSKRLA